MRRACPGIGAQELVGYLGLGHFVEGLTSAVEWNDVVDVHILDRDDRVAQFLARRLPPWAKRDRAAPNLLAEQKVEDLRDVCLPTAQPLPLDQALGATSALKRQGMSTIGRKLEDPVVLDIRQVTCDAVI
jgi:hypothetical protein